MSEHHAHTEGHEEHAGLSKGKIWQVFGILLLITVIEFIVALWVLPNGYMSHSIGNFVYIALTLSLIFIIYFIVLMLIEGGFLNIHMMNH